MGFVNWFFCESPSWLWQHDPWHKGWYITGTLRKKTFQTSLYSSFCQNILLNVCPYFTGVLPGVRGGVRRRAHAQLPPGGLRGGGGARPERRRPRRRPPPARPQRHALPALLPPAAPPAAHPLRRRRVRLQLARQGGRVRCRRKVN